MKHVWFFEGFFSADETVKSIPIPIVCSTFHQVLDVLRYSSSYQSLTFRFSHGKIFENLLVNLGTQREYCSQAINSAISTHYIWYKLSGIAKIPSICIAHLCSFGFEFVSKE